jgi:glycosyltransferase EpsD
METIRVLFAASVDRHIQAFHLPYISLLNKKGIDVDVVSFGNLYFPNVKKKINIEFPRSPFNLFKFLKSFHLVRKLLKENNYKFIHTHTPTTSLIIRLANITVSLKNKSKIIYTAHGFHFYQGSKIINWLIYFI